MKLHTFKPSGHGPQSFFVMAESESAARSLVSAHIKANRIDRYDSDGWLENNGENYTHKVYEPGQVVENDNS